MPGLGQLGAIAIAVQATLAIVPYNHGFDLTIDCSEMPGGGIILNCNVVQNLNIQH